MLLGRYRMLRYLVPDTYPVADKLADVLTGGDTDYADTLGEDDISALERQAFIALTRNEGTIERIETMLETGRPLRN